MIKIKNSEQIEILREGGKRLATILSKVALRAVPGITTKELDVYAESLIREGGDEPAFLNYKPEGVRIPYPASLCVSINNEVVHGIPSKDRVLKDGDIVSLDLGLKHKGLFTDHAITVAVGRVSKNAEKLLRVTEESLYTGIEEAREGNRVGDIGYAIESKIKPSKFGIIEILSGHGVGIDIHEDPYIPNFGKKGTGEKLVPGMVIAIEPMVNIGDKNVVLDKDGYTFRTKDGTLSAHFEHTVLITKDGPEILTKI